MDKTIQETLFNLILNSNRVDASELLEELAEQRGYSATLKEVLEPVLYEVGERWHKELSLAHGYIAGKIAEDFLFKATQSSEFNLNVHKKGSIVIGNVEDDYHALGRKMLATFLTAGGWEVYDLGNDVIASDFVDKAVETGAKIIGVSAMMYSTALNITKIRKEIENRGLNGKMLLAVGGAIFNLRPELVAELGGDITARNAIEADLVLTQALEKMKEAQQ